MYDTILLPTDGSDHALRAVEHGLALARCYGATVHTIAVVDVQRAAGMFSAGGIDREFVDRLEAIGEEHLQAIEAITQESDDVHMEVLRGEPWKSPSAGILQYADDHDIDMIVMGTHGRTGLDRVLLGSTTARVLRRAELPVLTVKPDGEHAEHETEDE